MPGLAAFPADEKTLLLSYVAQQRDGIRNAAFGLTDDQARLTPTAGTLSIGGLVKHVAGTERHWIDMVLGVTDDRPAEERAAVYAGAFTLRPDQTLAGVLDRYAAVARRTEQVLADVALEQAVPVPKGVPWFPADLDAWNVRWVLLHLVEETARHAGHADIVRESIDGATMYELMAAAEGWPATEWLKPWEPAAG
jgi:uncharacterized damage-inducible protein DinB